MQFSPDPATAAWVLTGCLSICTLIFIPVIGFLLARETNRRDADNKELLKRYEGMAEVLEQVKGMTHEMQLLVSELRLWVSQGFVPRLEYNKDLQLLREDIREAKGKH